MIACISAVFFLFVVGGIWIMRSRDVATRARCNGNLQVLSLGFERYVLRANELPFASRKGNPRKNDWVYWQSDRQFDEGVIAREISDFSKNVLRCPGDSKAASRPYGYSFTMNANLEDQDPTWFGNASSLILLFEEKAPNDGACAPGDPDDRLTWRHFGRSSALFADGHVEMVKESTGSKPIHVHPVERPPGSIGVNGLAPTDAIGAMRLPTGFHASLFAAEPDVKQPIAFTLDDRARLWVAECYTYPKRKGNPPGSVTSNGKLSRAQLHDIFCSNDRILIFEDTDGDGKFDKRTVFLEKFNFISGLEVGFGGVWIAAVPYLMFVPVNDWDHPKAAGDPQILLDGWDYSQDKTHEVPNTFTWGPDGWLYGCQGVFSRSNVGRPGGSKNQRQWVDGAIWRFHPLKHIFEVFGEGTTNPWGIDFDENGQCFATACVIPHLFHIIQGGRYDRAPGQHYPINADETARFAANQEDQTEKRWHPFIYDDIKTVADHLHYRGNQWDGRDRRTSLELGGGHAHAGLIIYQGDSFPAGYRGNLFMNNIHGARINMDIPERAGSGFVAHHGRDFIDFRDTWSQVLNLRSGPDGSVFMIDWYDRQQCHEKEPDQHDRSNGRIYRVSYGEKRAASIDLQKLSNENLVLLLGSSNSWHFRHAARILQERVANSPELAASVVKLLAPILEESPDRLYRLRALWALHLTTHPFDSPDFTLKYLTDEDEYIRAWTIQFACEDRNVSSAVIQEFERMAREDKSPVVRLYLASALQRMRVSLRAGILEALVAHDEDSTDHNLPLMYWFAAEPFVSQDVKSAVKLLAKAKIPQMRDFITRRMASGY